MFVTNSRDIQAMEKCRRQAQANANMSGKPWIVFQDTAGNYHVEIQRAGQQNVLKVLTPDHHED